MGLEIFFTLSEPVISLGILGLISLFIALNPEKKWKKLDNLEKAIFSFFFGASIYVISLFILYLLIYFRSFFFGDINILLMQYDVFYFNWIIYGFSWWFPVTLLIMRISHKNKPIPKFNIIEKKNFYIGVIEIVIITLFFSLSSLLTAILGWFYEYENYTMIFFQLSLITPAVILIITFILLKVIKLERIFIKLIKTNMKYIKISFLGFLVFSILFSIILLFPTKNLIKEEITEVLFYEGFRPNTFIQESIAKTYAIETKLMKWLFIPPENISLGGCQTLININGSLYSYENASCRVENNSILVFSNQTFSRFNLTTGGLTKKHQSLDIQFDLIPKDNSKEIIIKNNLNYTARNTKSIYLGSYGNCSYRQRASFNGIVKIFEDIQPSYDITSEDRRKMIFWNVIQEGEKMYIPPLTIPPKSEFRLEVFLEC